jgi:NADH:ubiquinone oxidoreductase subunit E
MPVADVETFDFSKVDRVLEKYHCEKSWLVMILQDTQGQYNWLPRPVLERVAERLGISISQVYNVATFYASFSLKERGQHIIKVCDGTACHLRGATWLRDAIVRKLGIKEGETTPDRLFTLESVACLGACALAPVMTVGSTIHVHMTPEKVKKALVLYRQASPAAPRVGAGAAAPEGKMSPKKTARARPKAQPKSGRGRRSG